MSFRTDGCFRTGAYDVTVDVVIYASWGIVNSRASALTRAMPVPRTRCGDATPRSHVPNSAKPLRRFRQYVRLSQHPTRRARMAKDVAIAAKKTTIAIAASLIGEAVVTQHGLTQEDVDLDLKEYLLGTALQLIIVSMML